MSFHWLFNPILYIFFPTAIAFLLQLLLHSIRSLFSFIPVGIYILIAIHVYVWSQYYCVTITDPFNNWIWSHVLIRSCLLSIGTCTYFKTTLQYSRKYFWKSCIKIMCCLKFQSFFDNYRKIDKVIVDVCEENMNCKCFSWDLKETQTFKTY